jgi:hypothetical protein
MDGPVRLRVERDGQLLDLGEARPPFCLIAARRADDQFEQEVALLQRCRRYPDLSSPHAAGFDCFGMLRHYPG